MKGGGKEGAWEHRPDAESAASRTIRRREEMDGEKKEPILEGTSDRLRCTLDCCGLRLRRATCGTDPPRNLARTSRRRKSSS